MTTSFSPAEVMAAFERRCQSVAADVIAGKLGHEDARNELEREAREDGLTGTAAEHFCVPKDWARRTIAAALSTPSRAEGLNSQDDLEINVQPWPELPLAALPGLAGEFVRLATHKNEADPAAVLATFLARFGCEVFGHQPGQGPYLQVGDTKHPPRLFMAIVGDSSKARKGTSASPVKRLFTFDDDHIPATCSAGPLSSGEGLVFAVRDQREEWQVDRKTKEGGWVVVDPGVTDKRLFVLDEELAAALHSTKREGNTLSVVMRSMWDSGDVAPLTKHQATKTTGANICITTHITIQELKALLDSVQAFNGFGNRFMWVCARRSKLVPFPEPMIEDQLAVIRKRLLERIRIAQGRGAVTMAAKARDIWAAIYPEISQDHPGLSGAIINRGEAQTLRLALVYALLDGAGVIDVCHLEAALAFWGYCRASAMFIFGSKQADPVAEKVLAALQTGPKTTTELHNALGRNYEKARLEHALRELIGGGKVRAVTEKTRGRPKTTFVAMDPHEKNELNEKSLITMGYDNEKRCGDYELNEKSPPAPAAASDLNSFNSFPASEYELSLGEDRTLQAHVFTSTIKDGSKASDLNSFNSYQAEKIPDGTTQADLARWCREQKDSGVDLAAIADKLEAAGVPAPWGKLWNRSQVHRLIHTPVEQVA